MMWLVGLVFVFCIGVFYATLWFDAQREVNAVPRVPMVDCPKHGLYPASAQLYIELPETEAKNFWLCPFCYSERLKHADSIMRRKSSDSV